MVNKPGEENFNPWSLEYSDYNPEKEKSRESLLTVGNGYLGTRGALEETEISGTNYPGTYIAGLYNRLVSKVSGKDIENEDFVNCPNWHNFNFRIDDGDFLNINQTKIVSIKRKLNFSNGLLLKEMVVEDKKGRQTSVKSKRIASMANPHLVAATYSVKPLNYKGFVEIKSVNNGNIINDGVKRYRDLNQQHLKSKEEGVDREISWLVVKTTQSDIEIAEVAKYKILLNRKETKVKLQTNAFPGDINCRFSVELNKGEEVTLEKSVAIYTSKQDDVEEPLAKSIELIKDISTFNSVLHESEKEWQKIWNKIDIQIEGDPKSQMLVRLHLYHLMVTVSPNNVNIDAGIPARGLHGEAYRGHIFWDELYILPIYNLFFPDVAKSILNYRYRRLNKAREYAKDHGYSGAMFPWQSGSDGREETQIIHLNPVSGEWGDDYSSLQRHISIAVAYNIWYYFQISDDSVYMEKSGAEMFFEICRFWASKCIFSAETGHYSILKVMGPDEFHETHKASKDGGLKDNAYTNIMVSWLFKIAFEMLHNLPESSKNKIKSKLKLSDTEIQEWIDISKKLNVPISKGGIIEQFDGYFDLKELDWDDYRERYGNIYRLDRILKAEGKSTDDYKLAKQADTLMTFYNIDEDIVREILEELGYVMPSDYLQKNYEYYIQRTSHGSTLSRVVHAYLANLFGDVNFGTKLFKEALESDYTDIQGGTTAEGIHAGVMGGTVLMVMTSFAGINFKKDKICIHPSLPSEWKSLKFNFTFKKNRYFVSLSHKQLEIEIKSEISEQIDVEFSNKKIILPTNVKNVLNY